MSIEREQQYQGYQGAPENTLGVSPAMFNFVFCLITGKAASTSDVMRVAAGGKVFTRKFNIDVWDCPAGIKFFRWFLFSA